MNAPVKTENQVAAVNPVQQYFQDQGALRKIKSILGEKAKSFVTTVLQLTATNSQLANANPETVYAAAVTAATLDLPVNPNFGFAYILPYNVNKKCKSNNWKDDWQIEAQLQIGYKGFIQLALRSGKFKSINVCPVYLDDTDEAIMSRLTSLFPARVVNKPIVGYVAWFKLLDGFEAHENMDMEELKEHAYNYSKTYKKAVDDKKDYSTWHQNYGAMCSKTVLKKLLTHWAPLSVDLQKAIDSDQAVMRTVNGEQTPDYVDNKPQLEAPVQHLDQAMFDQVRASISSGDLDKAFVLSGEAGYQLSEQQHAEIVGL